MTQKEQQADDEALQRIKQCLQKGAKVLELNGLGLTRVPAELGQLANLTTLYLHYNQLTALPAELGQLANLTTLSLSDNQLTALPAELGQLANLTHLYLHNNQLSALPAKFGQLANLTKLDLNNNQLSALPAKFGQLANLTQLYLNNNQLTALPAQFGDLANLSLLDLSNNQLTALPVKLGELANLTKLDLNNNQLSALPWELGQLADLTQLYLNNNQLTALPAQFGDLANLTQLDLSNNQLTALPVQLGQLANLTQLPLDSNKLTALPTELGQLANLTQLSLSDNQLTALPAELGQLAKLAKLDLNNNQLTALPSELGQLADLTQLYLNNNQLTALPSELGQLAGLTQLYLNNNHLTALPAELSRLADLTQLYLHHNQLTALPAELGQLAKLAKLDLNNNQLTALPSELGQLANLTQLDLSNNQLTALPAELGQLANLTQLYLHNNQLTALPAELGQLANLTTLDLSNNQLTALPVQLGQLANLTTLDLHNNQMTALSAELGELANLSLLDLSNNQLTALPVQLGQLANLTDLDLSNNQLTALPSPFGELANLSLLYLSNNQLTALPAQLGQLANLTTLDLENNQLTALPEDLGQLANLSYLCLQANRLVSLPSDLRKLRKLERLDLHDNPALHISPEVLGADSRTGAREGYASPQAILNFYFSRQNAATTRSLNEVKLLLVGRGEAGKTSTVRALRGEPFQRGEESTPGIALCDWEMAGCQREPIMAHVWDFAGQVITHALHRFFFSVRSLYVVVLTGRDDREREDAEYWLQLIKAFGSDDKGEGPPVIVTLNKWDKPGHRPKVDRGALRERYPFIRGFVETDCATGRGIEALNKLLCTEVEKLPWVREAFPGTWDAVRRALAEGGRARPHLPYAEYRGLCKKHGVTEERLQDSLSEILHNLGTALNYRSDPRLREATVLQPEWLTNHVYALMRHAETQEGVFRLADLPAVLSDEKDPAMHRYLVQLMERFEIAYAPKTDAGYWLVPQALPDEQPEGAAAFGREPEATRLRYSYTALPEGLVARAIVRLHELIEEADRKRQQWASGAILAREGARALLRKEPQDRVVMITVTGANRKARQQLAGLCQAELRDIHREILGLDPVEETQVRGAWVPTSVLEGDERAGRPTGIYINQATVLANPKEANDEYSEQPARTEEVWKPSVFMSYSKSNVSQRKRLELELKILMNAGLLAGHWHDRMIDPGDEWDPAIQHALEADVVIVLLTAHALANDYITKHEIPNAMAKHNAGQTVVVPLILEECRWDLTPLRKLNALPEKAKALNKWARPADAWKTVSEGLERVFRKLMAAGKGGGR